ncbi:hypothetical protein niasHS_009784 [Heterodera schachtii]|uniref:Uncharacterized protein n=1 Tax=Heterodera schachtii TaxID=97005 RepID=A0ABD2J3D1_HETSC
MSASSHLLLVVALASLAMSANTLKCWQGGYELGFLKREQCEEEPRPAFCTTFNCLGKTEPVQFTFMGCHDNSSFCDPGFNHETKFAKCDVQCCHDDFCNGKSNLIFGPPSGVIGLHTSFGICCIVFAVLIAAIFPAEFVKWF